MSVDYYHCECCEESIYEEFVGHCEECGKDLCTFCTINNEIDSRYEYDYRVKYDGSQEQKEKYDISDEDEEKGYVKLGEPMDDVGIDPKYCPFCSGNKYTDSDLLDYLLKKYNLERDLVVKEYLKTK